MTNLFGRFGQVTPSPSAPQPTAAPPAATPLAGAHPPKQPGGLAHRRQLADEIKHPTQGQKDRFNRSTGNIMGTGIERLKELETNLKDVLCLDQPRVILQGKDDYIHVNYVKEDPLLNNFICAQGPLIFGFLDCARTSGKHYHVVSS
ncbi:unnamed protein product, partial [Mesorhabditis belari]|uniref:Tyrosine-protein phosphatase domain-containing protein n=1 Tax=Mesorhabditis belari TaxID=2138241 RepID=A0AAF3EL17_9BILA